MGKGTCCTCDSVSVRKKQVHSADKIQAQAKPQTTTVVTGTAPPVTQLAYGSLLNSVNCSPQLGWSSMASKASYNYSVSCAHWTSGPADVPPQSQ